MSVAMLDQWFYMLFLLWRHNGCIMCNSTSHLRCFHHINTTLLYEYKFQYLHQCRRRHNHWTPVVQDFFRYLVDQVSSFSWHFPLSFFTFFFLQASTFVFTVSHLFLSHTFTNTYRTNNKDYNKVLLQHLRKWKHIKYLSENKNKFRITCKKIKVNK